MDYSKLTLGELLSHTNTTIQRNAISIYKTLIAIDKSIHPLKDRAICADRNCTKNYHEHSWMRKYN